MDENPDHDPDDVPEDWILGMPPLMFWLWVVLLIVLGGWDKIFSPWLFGY